MEMLLLFMVRENCSICTEMYFLYFKKKTQFSFFPYLSIERKRIDFLKKMREEIADIFTLQLLRV